MTANRRNRVNRLHIIKTRMLLADISYALDVLDQASPWPAALADALSRLQKGANHRLTSFSEDNA